MSAAASAAVPAADANSTIDSDTVEALERFLDSELNISQIVLNEDALNDEIQQTSINKVNVLAVLLDRSLKENSQLKVDLNFLYKQFEELRNECQLDRVNSKIIEESLLESKKFIKNHADSSIQVYEKVLDNLADFKCEFDELHDEFNDLKENTEGNYSNITSLERDLNDLQQYIRRPTIEISGVSDRIHQSILEDHVIHNILAQIGVYVSTMDIVACHRLQKRNPNKPAPVVVRFVNRKHAVMAIKNRAHLKHNRNLRGLFIFDNLCPRYREIFDRLSQLRSEGNVQQVWSYNGKVFYKLNNYRNSRGKRIGHMNDMIPLLRDIELRRLELVAENESILNESVEYESVDIKNSDTVCPPSKEQSSPTVDQINDVFARFEADNPPASQNIINSIVSTSVTSSDTGSPVEPITVNISLTTETPQPSMDDSASATEVTGPVIANSLSREVPIVDTVVVDNDISIQTVSTAAVVDDSATYSKPCKSYFLV